MYAFAASLGPTSHLSSNSRFLVSMYFVSDSGLGKKYKALLEKKFGVMHSYGSLEATEPYSCGTARETRG